MEDGHTFLSLFHTRARVRTANDSSKAPWAGTSQLERPTYTTKIPDDLFDEGPFVLICQEWETLGFLTEPQSHL